MTAKDGFYGRDDVDYRKKLIPNSDEAYFLQVNEKTGDIEAVSYTHLRAHET